jgi:hypothetical protein
MGRTSNQLHPYPEELLNQATGSVFTLNNTSYSGADIKVVVHSYDSAVATQQETSEIRKSLLQSEASLKSTNSSIKKAEQTIFTTPTSSPSWNKANRLLTSLTTQKADTLRTIASLQKRLTELEKQMSSNFTKVLAEVQTLSLSVFRDKQAVRSLGSVYPKGFTRGPREISGTLVFTVFDEHVLYQFLGANIADFDHSKGITSALADQLPPVDITISFANELGSVSRMSILGVEFVEEGQTMSIEDLITENVVTFVARDFDPMRSVKQRKIDEQSRLIQSFSAKRASDLIFEEDYQKLKSSISPFARFARRRNPYQ